MADNTSDKKNTTKTRFINEADKLFFQKGYENVSVEEICKAAGKAKGLFFYYFDKKETIVKLLMEMQVERMAEALKRKIARERICTKKMNILMQALLSGEKGGPRAMYYFKTRPLPVWVDSYAHILKDKHIYPLIKKTVSIGAKSGEFKESSDEQVEIIYLGISQFMHKHFDQMTDINYAKSSMYAITRVLEKSLGIKKGSIVITPDIGARK